VCAEDAGNVLVRQAMEAVATHAAIGDGLREREGLRDRRLRAMERGVEAGDLWQLRRPYEQVANRREIVRLMQRRERDECLEPGEHGLVDAHRQGVVETPVENSMPHAAG